MKKDPATRRGWGILQILVIAFLTLPLLAQFIVAGTDWPMGDMQGYWDAAIRLREGAPLYNPPPPGVDDQLGVYRHAPWFAAAWVPLTFLPHGAVVLVWSLAICAAIGYIMWSFASPLTPAGVAAALLIGWLTLQTGMFGNLQALMVAGLIWGFPRRSGPAWIAVAASLKIAPILFVLAYAREREWRRVAWTLGLTALLWAPALAFNWQAIGGKGSEPWWPWIIAPALAVWWWRPSLLGVLVIAAYPVLHTSYVSYLAVIARPTRPRSARTSVVKVPFCAVGCHAAPMSSTSMKPACVAVLDERVSVPVPAARTTRTSTVLLAAVPPAKNEVS